MCRVPSCSSQHGSPAAQAERCLCRSRAAQPAQPSPAQPSPAAEPEPFSLVCRWSCAIARPGPATAAPADCSAQCPPLPHPDSSLTAAWQQHTVQVRLQTQSATNPIYRGSWDCVAQTVRKEGVLAVYKGRNPRAVPASCCPGTGHTAMRPRETSFIRKTTNLHDTFCQIMSLINPNSDIHRHRQRNLHTITKFYNAEHSPQYRYLVDATLDTLDGILSIL